jgi:hypothetical protein
MNQGEFWWGGRPGPQGTLRPYQITHDSVGGGYVCADVRSGDLAPLTPIEAYDCNAAPNQQFEFNDFTIYALGGQRCVDVMPADTAAGTPVDFYNCNGTVAQQWYYYNGEIHNPYSGMCLDAGDVNNLTQLVIYLCNGTLTQN